MVDGSFRGRRLGAKIISTSAEDFAKLGLTPADWGAFILGRGTIAAHKLDAARAAVARLGRYSEKQARDTQLTDSALRRIATQYPHLWLEVQTLTDEEKIRFVQAERGCSREEAERHLDQVRKDREEEARIFGEGKGKS